MISRPITKQIIQELKVLLRNPPIKSNLKKCKKTTKFKTTNNLFKLQRNIGPKFKAKIQKINLKIFKFQKTTTDMKGKENNYIECKKKHFFLILF